jgi:hypothetical protein
MTRANLFAAEGLEYDIRAVRQHEGEYREQELRKGKQVFFIPRELDSDRLQERHEQIDFLAGVTAAHRSPDDTVRVVVFDRLGEMVNVACSDLHEHVNKSVAHAATPESRQRANAQSASLTLNHLYMAQAAICKAAAFLDLYLLTGSDHSLLAIPQYDQFAHIDKPLVTTEGVPTLREAWEKYGAETADWTDWGIDGFRREFPQEHENHDPQAV